MQNHLLLSTKKKKKKGNAEEKGKKTKKFTQILSCVSVLHIPFDEVEFVILTTLCFCFCRVFLAMFACSTLLSAFFTMSTFTI